MLSVNQAKMFNTATEVFATLGPREYYRTSGMTELLLEMASSLSYRKTIKLLNRVRLETTHGTPLTTAASIVEREGDQMQQTMDQWATTVLHEQQFTDEGKPTTQEEHYGLSTAEASLPSATIGQAIETYNRDKKEAFQIDAAAANQFYEDPDKTVNISIDDVGVKKQKESGRSASKPMKEAREYVHNTIAHVEQNRAKYIVNGTGTLNVLRLVIALLLHNGLLTDYYLCFFVDGARTLHAAIIGLFSWLPHMRIILDWYHLEKKCKYELSLTLKGAKIRNAILDNLLPLLWLGKVEETTAYLRTIPAEQIKSGQSVDRLIGYFERNRDHIPCYALRKQLGLRNSSNKGEKANDLCVADRQKHNGMSWSTNGTVALATVIAMHRNGENETWCSRHQLEFKLAS